MAKPKKPYPKVMVLSSLFPSSVEPGAGLFVRERMFRIAEHLPLFVVSPKPWFPLQSLIQLFKPSYRKSPEAVENIQGIKVYYPRFIFKDFLSLLFRTTHYEHRTTRIFSTSSINPFSISRQVPASASVISLPSRNT